jgi:protoporphyrinogen oxidase
MLDIAILGAGPAGLACGYHLLGQGHRVTIFEADDRPGGMSAHFDFEGLDLERFYHFVCTPDEALFELLRELGIESELEWRVASMGYFCGGRLHDWGNPLALLLFPHLSLLSKIRYGLHTYTSIKRSSADGLENQNAIEWVKKWVGTEVYDLLWRPLFELKFFQYADNLSAAWIWTRIKRLGLSRQNLFHERLGYLRGGSQTLIARLVDEIERRGGSLRLSAGVQHVGLGKQGVESVRTASGSERFDCVVSTIPIPYVPKIIPDLPKTLLDRYARLDNIGAICVLFKLSRSLSKYFWLNTSDPEMEIPGVIEFSRLRPLDDHVVYVPYYLPQDHPRFGASDEELIEESLECLQRINPDLKPRDVLATRVTRLRYAQPICPPGFQAMLPPIETEVSGLYVADTSYYYPEDRSISESVRLGRRLANAVASSAFAMKSAQILEPEKR